jgi:hypothetical protein
MSSTTITRGNSHETFYIQPSLTPTSVTNGTTSAQTFTVPGLQVGDLVNCWGLVGSQASGIVAVEADVNAANTLTIQFGNISGSPVTPTAGAYVIEVVRLEGPAPTNAA